MKRACFLTTVIGSGLLALGFLPSPARAAVGDLYVTDFGAHEVFEFTPTGVRTTFAGVINAAGLAFDGAGNLFVSGNSSTMPGSTGAIFKITSAGAVSMFASGLQAGPQGLAFDSAGNLYTAGPTGNIFKFTPTGVQTTFASGLGNPWGLAIDSANNLYVTDLAAGAIYKFNAAGTRTTFVSGGQIYPVGLFLDRSGNLLDTDTRTGTVNTFAPSGAKIGTLSGFASPQGVTEDAAGNVFVSDQGAAGSVIYEIAPNGTRTTFASGLNKPHFLAFQPAGPSGQLLSISTRLDVLTGNEVEIAGFVIKGNANKKVLVGALGPTLAQFGVPNVLPDPVLTLHHTDAQGHDTVIATNDNWRIPASNETAVQATGKAPPSNLESALVLTLPPGAYTAIVTGKGTQTGNGLVEMYDLDGSASTTLSSISTRGFVQTGNDVMIAGVTSGGAGPTTVLVRALGPTLSQFGVPTVLANPELELHDANGTLIASNNDWVSSLQKAQIQATGLAPPNNLEPAIISTLPAGNMTAIVSGVNNTTGNALVEVYTLP